MAVFDLLVRRGGDEKGGQASLAGARATHESLKSAGELIFVHSHSFVRRMLATGHDIAASIVGQGSNLSTLTHDLFMCT